LKGHQEERGLALGRVPHHGEGTAGVKEKGRFPLYCKPGEDGCRKKKGTLKRQATKVQDEWDDHLGQRVQLIREGSRKGGGVWAGRTLRYQAN